MRDSTEVVQVYVRKANDIEGPIKTLRGFKRVDIKSGKTMPVEIDLPSSSFEFYDRGQRQMAIDPVEYEAFYGNGSDSKDLIPVTITVQQ